ncbi:11S globulin seed storage protein 2-like protein [Tanacetum coccineum]
MPPHAPLASVALSSAASSDFTATQLAQRFEFEGISIETWDVNDNQFQCVGVAPSRNTIQPNYLSLPTFQPFPRLVFVKEDYQEMINLCKHKTKACKAEVASDAKINLLKKELDEEL